MNYIALGYDVTDQRIEQNEKYELFVDRKDQAEAEKSWCFYHRMHNRDARVSNGVCYCPRCGQYAMVKQDDRRTG